MTVTKKSWTRWGAVAIAGTLLLAGCGNNEKEASPAEPLKVTLVLDWTPNTNHTGLYVAQEQGLWAKHGLEVEIVQPPEAGASSLVAAGKAEFGIGAQEGMIQARSQGLPLVSIAPIIQHNTSGFASPVDRNIKEPKDFEGKTYGGWNTPAEEAVISSLMALQGADVKKVNFVNAGTADFFSGTKNGIDFEWIFYGWDGIQAELRNEPINMVYLTDYSKQLDYYTPLILTNEKLIQEKPEVVREFLAGASEGYQYAIDHPEESADILLKAVPELNAELVKASQKWLSPKYKDDAPRWGVQKLEVWSGYGDWLKQNKLLDKDLDYNAMFTNEFLPK
ncbi:ABC transporter substrate-binding protein [Cohnella panacarvi]|uniref:ABC transporter substrate-binding protein n=1 Tax=Cohnella panacarvi TaxID=400776 RepID=UPI00047AC958|nr:ABC transporter substrate-binding protein [Cohnella panacarvi]